MSDLTARIEGLVHEPTQVHDGGVDLTVADVSVVSAPGRVDFGGGELADATLSPVETHLRNPDDDYEWWHLEGGTYLVEHNERLAGADPVTVRTRPELRARGAYHPTLRTSSLGAVPLTVAEGGIRVKENARISTVARD